MDAVGAGSPRGKVAACREDQGRPKAAGAPRENALIYISYLTPLSPHR